VVLLAYAKAPTRSFARNPANLDYVRAARFIGAASPAGHGLHRYVIVVHALDVATIGIPADARPAYLGFTSLGHPGPGPWRRSAPEWTVTEPRPARHSRAAGRSP
jgi:hypothetical protein